MGTRQLLAQRLQGFRLRRLLFTPNSNVHMELYESKILVNFYKNFIE